MSDKVFSELFGKMPTLAEVVKESETVKASPNRYVPADYAEIELRVMALEAEILQQETV